MQKILVTLPEKFEATITLLENTKDLSNITLAELLNFLNAHEQRRMLRNEGTFNGALQARHQFNVGGKRRKQMQLQQILYIATKLLVMTSNSSLIIIHF